MKNGGKNKSVAFRILVWCILNLFCTAVNFTSVKETTALILPASRVWKLKVRLKKGKNFLCFNWFK